MHDTGVLTIEGVDTQFKIVNAEKVGKVVLHILDKEVPDLPDLKGKNVHVEVDEHRRN